MRSWAAARRAVAVAARGLIGATTVALLGAIAYELVGAGRDALGAARVGRAVDVGGRALNIHCVGAGSPTVIFDAGAVSPGYVWTPTQREVATFTRACWYDRAGLGWSDPGPDPSWGDAAARDLHRLLPAAGLTPPYVLVGASFGGYVARVYHDAYRSEVVGLVLVDAAHEDAGTIEGMPHRERPRIPRWLMRGLSMGLGHLGLVRMMSPDPGVPPAGWRAEEWALFARLRRQRKNLLADAQHGPEEATARLVRSTGGLERLPLIVLTQGRTPRDPDSVEARVLRGWIDLQARLAQRSERGRQVIVRSSGHGIPVEAPEAIVTAVREIVAEVRPSHD